VINYFKFEYKFTKFIGNIQINTDKMNKYLLLVLSMTLLFVVIIGCASSCNSNKIVGNLYVAGNEPFTHLAIKTEDGTVYKLKCSEKTEKELRQLQGKTLKLELSEIKKFEKVNIAVVKNYKTISDNQ